MPRSTLHSDPAELREFVDHRLPAEAAPAGVLDLDLAYLGVDGGHVISFSSGRPAASVAARCPSVKTAFRSAEHFSAPATDRSGHVLGTVPETCPLRAVSNL